MIQPYFREFDGWWYVQLNVGGKRRQLKLAQGRDNEKQAYQKFYRVMASEGLDVPGSCQLKIADVCDLFLDWSKTHNSQRTYDWYREYLQSFCDRYGHLPALDLKPLHVTKWLDGHPKWKNSRRCATVAVKRAYNWCFDEGLLAKNPTKKVKRPKGGRRERILTPEEQKLILDSIKDAAFREFFYAMQETGCRPGEISFVGAESVGDGTWELAEHKTKKHTDKPRIIYLTPGMIELTRRLALQNAEGPLFRNSKGRPWNRNSLRCRFKRLRQKFPQLKGVVCYTLRHTYATDAMERGVPAATVAELMGHKDIKMIEEHYGHLSQKRQHLQDAAKKAAGYVEGQKGSPAA